MIGRATPSGISRLRPAPRFAKSRFLDSFRQERGRRAIARESLFNPYEHQMAMLQRGLRPGILPSSRPAPLREDRDVHVARARRDRERSDELAKTRQRLFKRTLVGRTAMGRSRLSARGGIGTASAVRALILYPMNALVEDQMTRLRRTLDSDEARSAMDRHLGGNRIFFGRYTGATPVTGFLKPSATWRRRRRKCGGASARSPSSERACRNREGSRTRPRRHDVATQGKPEFTQFLFPAADGAEMLSPLGHAKPPPRHPRDQRVDARYDARSRGRSSDLRQDAGMAGTRPGGLLLFILDELHLIRGSAGNRDGWPSPSAHP